MQKFKLKKALQVKNCMTKNSIEESELVDGKVAKENFIFIGIY